MKKSITAVLAFLMLTFAAPAQAGKFNDFFAGIFTILTAPIGIFCPNVALFKRNNPWRKREIVEKIIHTDSLKTRLSSVQDKAVGFVEEYEKLRKEEGEARKAVVAAQIRAKQHEDAFNNEAGEKTKEKIEGYNKELRKLNEKQVETIMNYAQKLLNTFRSLIKLNDAFVEVSHLKGSDEETIEKYRTEAFSLRKTAAEINEKFKEFKDLSFAEIYSKSLKEFREFCNYIYCVRGNCGSQQKS
jgi:hypothetical protein